MNQSESIVNIIPALILSKDRMGKVVMNSVNPHFKSKYADLGSLMEASSLALALNNLVVVQMPSQDSTGYYVETTLYHTSGEFLSGKTYINPTKNDPQGLGSAITYAKRYGLGSLLGLIGEEDDDGNAASTPVERVYKPQPYAPPAKPTAVSTPAKSVSGSITGNTALDALFGKPAGGPPPLPKAKATAAPKAGDPWSTEALVSAVQDGESAEEYTW